MDVQRNTGPFWVLLASLIFSTLGTAQALAPADATPYLIGTIRMLGGGLALLAWCAFRKLLPTRHGWWRIETPICILSLFAFQICFFEGMQQLGVAVGTVIAIGTAPIATGLICFIFLRERLAVRWFIFTPLAIIGLLFLTLTGSTAIDNLQGLILVVLAGFFYAAYIVASKRLVSVHNPETLTMVLSLAAGICMIPMIITHPMAWVFTLHGLGVATHLSIGTVAIAFTLLVKGLQTTPAPIAATLSLAEPLGAALLGVFLLGETLSLWAQFGMACMFLAIIGLMWPVKLVKI